MRAVGDYVVFRVQKKEEKTTKSGIVMLQSNEGVTTNSGDKLGTATDFIVESIGPGVEIALQVGDKCVVNLWQAQLFEENEKEYAVLPVKEIKVILEG